MPEVPGYVRRGAWRRRLVLVQLGIPARQPCSKLGRFVRLVSRAEQGARRAGVVPSYIENHRR